MADIGNFKALSQYAEVTRTLGSPFVASILEAGERQLAYAPRTASLIADWTGNSAAAGLAMRFNGAIHALARQEKLPLLSALYRQEHGDFDGALRSVLEAEDEFVAQWMRDPPQTNEVGRSASIVSALMVARRHHGLPTELLEIGSSCGLNLNLQYYSYTLGGQRAGQPESIAHIAPEWRGPDPVIEPLEIVSAKGVDLKPLDSADPATRERLLSFIWADERERSRRLEMALDLAQTHRPMVARGNALPWLARELARPQTGGVARTIFHSMVLQYLGQDDRNALIGVIEEAGSRATTERPLSWISFEWTPDRSEVQLRLTCWPDGTTQTLAICHPYGHWIQWLD